MQCFDFKQLRNFCEKTAIPLISPQTEDFLKNIITQYQPKRFLEIGSAVGYSTNFIAHLLSQWWGIIYSFEVSYPSYVQCIRNTQLLSFPPYNIVPYFLDFRQVPLSKIITQKVDMIFIDAQKSQYLNYLQEIKDYITDNWIIILDDIIKFQNKTSSLYEYLSKKQINYEIFEMEVWDWIMIIKAKDLK